MLLTSRQKRILAKIAEQDNFITVNMLAEHLAVSKKTIQRELEVVELYLHDFNASLIKKPAYGVKLALEKDNIDIIINSISENTNTVAYGKTERCNFIIMWLLKENEPIKTYFFTKRLKVTEATIANDFIKCEQWLADNGVKLIKKQGVGIYIESREICIRRAMRKLIVSSLDWNTITDKKDKKPLAQKILAQDSTNLINKPILEQIVDIAGNIKHKYFAFANDHAYINFLINLYVFVLRIRDGKNTELDTNLFVDSDIVNELSTAKEIAKILSESFKIDISNNEVTYLTMLLIGARSSDYSQTDEKIKIVVDKMIGLVENKTSLVLTRASRFYESFLSHFTHAYKRISLGLEITNPLIDNIKEHYRHVYNMAVLCAKIAEDELGISIPPEEIGFIAMHLGTALEDKEVSQNRVCKIVVSCPSGMVSSRLLAARLLKEFNNINIVQNIATSDFDQEKLMAKGINFIVSTADINTGSIPCVKVSPFLLESDKLAVEKKIKEILS